MSLWVSYLQVPQDALQKLWKPEGHMIPGDLEKLVNLLKNTRDPLKKECESLERDYDSYVRFCKSISMATEDIQLTQGREDFTSPKGLAGVIEEAQSKDVLKEIRVTFADIERLRTLERTIKDLDGLIDLLSRVSERFASIGKQGGQEIRLFVNSTGKGLSFRLVYGHEAPPASSMPAMKTIEEPEVSFDTLNVERWMEYGMRAILGKGSTGEVAT
jgi:hypothetical protein